MLCVGASRQLHPAGERRGYSLSLVGLLLHPVVGGSAVGAVQVQQAWEPRGSRGEVCVQGVGDGRWSGWHPTVKYLTLLTILGYNQPCTHPVVRFLFVTDGRFPANAVCLV